MMIVQVVIKYLKMNMQLIAYHVLIQIKVYIKVYVYMAMFLIIVKKNAPYVITYVLQLINVLDVILIEDIIQFDLILLSNV